VTKNRSAVLLSNWAYPAVEALRAMLSIYRPAVSWVAKGIGSADPSWPLSVD